MQASDIMIPETKIQVVPCTSSAPLLNSYPLLSDFSFWSVSWICIFKKLRHFIFQVHCQLLNLFCWRAPSFFSSRSYHSFLWTIVLHSCQALDFAHKKSLCVEHCSCVLKGRFRIFLRLLGLEMPTSQHLCVNCFPPFRNPSRVLVCNNLFLCTVSSVSVTYWVTWSIAPSWASISYLLFPLVLTMLASSYW